MASQNLRSEQVELYRFFINHVYSPQPQYDQITVDTTIASTLITIKVSSKCSCGRFFEQHPTSIEETEGEKLDIFLQSILDGFCKCVTHEDRESLLGLQEVERSFLHLAASLGSCHLVKLLVDEVGCDINLETKIFHFTALSLAVMQTKDSLVQWLCEQPGIQVNIKSKSEKHTPLIDAMLAEKFLLVDILTTAKGIDLNTTNFRYETPLIVAIRMNNHRLVKQLLLAGADHTLPAPDGTPPLHLATRAGYEIVQEFVDANVPLDVPDMNGDTALIYSVRNRTLDVTSVLVQGGADPNANPDLPCFVLAASLGLVRTMVFLWEKGQDPNVANSQGWTALHYACMKGFTTMAQLLLKAGAASDCVMPCDVSPLGLAVFYRCNEIVETLLAHKCQVNVFDADMDTPLHYAAINGDTDLVRSLLDVGANACSINRIGVTPLFNAAVSNKTAIVKMLLPHYVDEYLHFKTYGFEYDSWNSKNILFEDGERSVFWVSAYNGNLSMASALLYAGFNAFGEEWIHERNFPEAILSGDNVTLINFLVEVVSAPSSLLSLCRCAVRNVFGPGKQRKANQISCLPRKIKNFIMLRDIDNI